MLNFTLNILLSSLVLFLTIRFVPGIVIENITALKVSGLLLGFLNFLIRPMLLLMEIVPTLRTLGVFSFILNLVFLNLAMGLTDDFDYQGISASIFGAILLAIGQITLNRMPLEGRNTAA